MDDFINEFSLDMMNDNDTESLLKFVDEYFYNSDDESNFEHEDDVSVNELASASYLEFDQPNFINRSVELSVFSDVCLATKGQTFWPEFEKLPPVPRIDLPILRFLS